MIRHIVMLHLRADADMPELATVMQGLDALVHHLDGLSGFVAGPNRDYEAKSPDHPYGFTLDAASPAALAAYADHPDHKALGARLVAQCAGGGDGIVVYDIEAGG